MLPFAQGTTQGHCKFNPILTSYHQFLQGADHGARKAAVNQNFDIPVPLATDPFYNLFWLSMPYKDGSHAEELRVLT